MPHWADVFGNTVTAAEVVAAAQREGVPLAQYLQMAYAELGAENPDGGWDAGCEPDFDALARQVLQEAQHPVLLGDSANDSLDAPATITLTTAHAASSYGKPVLLLDGVAYGPGDMTPYGVTAAELVDAIAGEFCMRPSWAGASDYIAALRAIASVATGTLDPAAQLANIIDFADRVLREHGL